MSRVLEILSHHIKVSNIEVFIQNTLGLLWCTVENKKAFIKVIEILYKLNARVCMITCHTLTKSSDDSELVYHFDISGSLVNLKILVQDKMIPSITPYFKSADWAEREMGEMYGIKVENHPNPTKLFLDESIKESVLSEYFSLSQVMSSKLSQELWQKVEKSSNEALK